MIYELLRQVYQSKVTCIWQLRNVANGSILFEWKIRLNIQVMHKILYIQPLFNSYAYSINATR